MNTVVGILFGEGINELTEDEATELILCWYNESILETGSMLTLSGRYVINVRRSSK